MRACARTRINEGSKQSKQQQQQQQPSTTQRELESEKCNYTKQNTILKIRYTSYKIRKKKYGEKFLKKKRRAHINQNKSNHHKS